MQINSLTLERAIEHEEIPVIKLTSNVPVLTGASRNIRRINAFYAHLTDALEKQLRRKMLKRAVSDFNDALSRSRPFDPYRVKMTFEAMENEESNQLEISRRLYIRSSAGAEYERSITDIWNLRLGLPDKLKSDAVDYSLLVK